LAVAPLLLSGLPGWRFAIDQPAGASFCTRQRSRRTRSQPFDRPQAAANYATRSTSSRAARISAFTCLVSARSINQCPPFQAFLEARALPSAVRGPLDRSQGRQRRINAA
jgi:hypothetical protein